MKTELKPCPFCGGEAKLKQISRLGITISCSKCNAKMIQRVLKYSIDWLEEKMIEKWNNRSQHVEQEPCDYCGGSGFDPYPNHDTTMRPCYKCEERRDYKYQLGLANHTILAMTAKHQELEAQFNEKQKAMKLMLKYMLAPNDEDTTIIQKALESTHTEQPEGQNQNICQCYIDEGEDFLIDNVWHCRICKRPISEPQNQPQPEKEEQSELCSFCGWPRKDHRRNKCYHYSDQDTDYFYTDKEFTPITRKQHE